MRPQHFEMLTAIYNMRGQILPENMSRQEDPLSSLQQRLFCLLYTGLTGSTIHPSSISEYFDTTVEGFYKAINTFILLGCAINIVDQDITIAEPNNVDEFVDVLLNINGPSIALDHFTYEYEHNYSQVD